MAYRKRYRKRRGVWFQVADIYGGLVSTYNQLETIEAAPMLLDEPVNDATGVSALGGLALASHTGYYLRRIVGQIHITHQQNDAVDVVTTRVGAGIIVDRVGEGGALQNLTAWNPIAAHAKQKRWLWRREWMLANNTIQPGGNTTDWPTSNVEYGDIRSGTQVDWKGFAKVGYEERLFLILYTRAWLILQDGSVDGAIYYTTNLRAYGGVGMVNTR